MRRPTAIVYVDGFNFYKSRVQKLPATKWLDFNAFCSRLLPQYRVKQVKYFTTIVNPVLSPRPGADIRQLAYVRALRATGVDVHLGRFKSKTPKARLVPLTMDPVTGDWKRTAVRVVEEKQTDVGIGVQMIADAFRRRAKVFVLLSNDSDQVPTLKMLRSMNRRTAIIFPLDVDKRANKELKQTKPEYECSFTDQDMLDSQLPDTVSDKNGTAHRPKEWA